MSAYHDHRRRSGGYDRSSAYSRDGSRNVRPRESGGGSNLITNHFELSLKDEDAKWDLFFTEFFEEDPSAASAAAIPTAPGNLSADAELSDGKKKFLIHRAIESSVGSREQAKTVITDSLQFAFPAGKLVSESTIKVVVPSRSRDPRKKGINETWFVKFKKVGQVGDSHKLQFMNIAVKCALNDIESLTRIGRRGFFNMQKKDVIQRTVAIYEGFDATITIVAGERLPEYTLLVEPRVKLLPNLNVGDQMSNIINLRGSTLRGPLDESRRSRLMEKFFEQNPKQRNRQGTARVKIFTDHNKMEYEMIGFCWDETANTKQTFRMREKGSEERKEVELSFSEYFRRRYNIPCPCGEQGLPLIKATRLAKKKNRGDTKENADVQKLPPSLCYLTHIPAFIGDGYRRDLTRRLQKNPAQVLRSIESVVSEISDNLGKFGIVLKKRPLEIPHETLSRLSLNVGRNRVPVDARANWQNALRGRVFEGSYNVLVLTELDERAVQRSIDDMRSKGSCGLTFNFKTCDRLRGPGDVQNEYGRICRDIGKPHGVMTIFRGRDTPEGDYDKLKNFFLAEKVPHQHLCQRGAMSKGLSALTKVCVQLYHKMGGRPFACSYQDMKSLVEHSLGTTLVCAVDYESVYQNQWTVGLVSSRDPFYANFDSHFATQNFNFGVEPATLTKLLDCVLKKWEARLSSGTPRIDTIVIYRPSGGTSKTRAPSKTSRVMFSIDGEINGVIAAIKRNRGVFNGRPPLLIYVDVNKRPNERFFMKSSHGPVQNVPAGTKIDRRIVPANAGSTFYLQSHNSGKFLSKPVKYEIVSTKSRCDKLSYEEKDVRQYCRLLGDDTEKEDAYKRAIEELTNLQTCLYSNWTGAIRIPSIVLSARKAVEMYARLEPTGLRDGDVRGHEDSMFFL